jgi:hypothetical protein
MFFALLSWLAPLVAAFFFMRWFGLPCSSSPLCWGLAFGLALGITSANYYLCLLAFRPPGDTYRLTELILFTFLAAFFGHRSRRARILDGLAAPKQGRDLLGLVLILVLVTSVHVFFLLSHEWPHGKWDAWSIWNLRARFFYRGSEHWTDAFSPLTQHPDYPLLLPASVARGWLYWGEESAWVPIQIALGFCLATVGLLHGSLAILRDRRQGTLGALLLLSTPAFIALGTWLYADIPLAFYILATAVLYSWNEQLGKDHAGLLSLAGFMAGLAAWTKNEGLFFVLAAVLAGLIVGIPHHQWKTTAGRMIIFAAGALPILALVAYFKLVQAPANDLVAGQSWADTTSRLADWSRYRQVTLAWGEALLQFGPYMIWVLLAYFVLLGPAPRPWKQNGLDFCLCLLVLQAAGYFFAFITTPHDLQWHLETALNRLLVQLWPLVVFSFFLAVATPAEAQQRRTVGSLPLQ